MNNIYGAFTEKILDLPLWVKEIVYFILKRNLQMVLPCSNIDEQNEESLYQNLCPEITYAGKKELERLRAEEPNSMEYKFLEALTKNKNIIEITLNNIWTLEETSQIYCECIEKQFVARPASAVINAKASYFANKIRIGEYLKRIGLIDVDQLENAMRLQKESELANEKKGFATILVDMNLVTRDDTDNILLLKQESKKRFVLNFSTSGNPEVQNDLNQHLDAKVKEDEAKIERLTYENNLLKSKLREMLNLGK